MHPRGFLTRFGSALLLTLIAATASAQSRFYVGGTAIADIRRFDSLELDPRILASLADISSRDGTAPGGGVRVGTFLHPLWSLELAVDAGSKTSNSFQNPIEQASEPLVDAQAAGAFDQQQLSDGQHCRRFSSRKNGTCPPWLPRRNGVGQRHLRIDISDILVHSDRAPLHDERVLDSRPRVSHASGFHHHGRDAATDRQFSRGRVRVRSGHRFERSLCASPWRQSHRVLQRGAKCLPHQTRNRRTLEFLIPNP